MLPDSEFKKGNNGNQNRSQARPDDINTGQTSRWDIRYRTHGSKLPDLLRDSLSRWQGFSHPDKSQSLNEREHRFHFVIGAS